MLNKVQEETEGIAIVNEQFRIIERSFQFEAFELVADALVHAERGNVHPRFK